MANKHATQGALLAECLKKRRHTYMQMLGHGVSTCPWKRVQEWCDRNPAWMVQPGKDAKGNTTWRVVKNPGYGLPF